MKLHTAPLALVALAVFAQAKTDAAGPPARASAARTAASSSKLPETNLLGSDLGKARTTLMSLSARTKRVEKTTARARKKVEEASEVIHRVDQIDDLLIRVIRQLTPVSKLPPTRELRPVVLNLNKLQKQVHKVRVKGDAVQKKDLAPLRARLKTVESKLKKANSEIDETAHKVDQAHQHLDMLRDFVESHNNTTAAAGLETLSRETRAAFHPLYAGLKAIDDASGGAEKDLNGLAKDLSPLTATGPALQKLQRDLTPVNNAARELDKVLNRRIAVRVFGKSIGFTVRQVIEGPGKVADIVLAPLEKLADAALKPVLHSLKLEIPTPHELTAIEHSLEAVGQRLTALSHSTSRLEAALQSSSLAAFRGSLDSLDAKSPSQLKNKS